MRIAIYPGSFNPWHDGHHDILKKALTQYDVIVIAVGINPDKPDTASEAVSALEKEFEDYNRVRIVKFAGLLVDEVKKQGAVAVIRGLRNSQDLEMEKTQQYWNEDLGMEVPTVFFVADRKLSHISSSAIRAVRKFK